MKQAQSEPTRHRSSTHIKATTDVATQQWRWVSKPVKAPAPRIKPLSSWSVAQLLMTLFATLWFSVTLPFRLAFWIIAWLGRLTAVLLGFSLMVLGIALWAGPLVLVGIPLFVVGLVFTLRCLD